MTRDGGTVEIEGAADPLPNPRHEAFARLVASGMAHAAAYREAGYNSKTPDAHAARLADSGSIAARIAYLRHEKAQAVTAASLVDAHRIQQELEALALYDIGDAFETEVVRTGDEGTDVIVPRLRPLPEWPATLRRSVSKIKVRRYLEGHGDDAREVELVEFALHNKTQSIHELRAHMGLLQPKQVNVNVQGVIALPVMQIPQPSAVDRVLDGAEDHARVVAAPPAAPLTAARAGLLARLTGPR